MNSLFKTAQKFQSLAFKTCVILLVPMVIFFYCPDASVNYYYISNFDAEWKYPPLTFHSSDVIKKDSFYPSRKKITYWLKDTSLTPESPDVLPPALLEKADSILIIRWKNIFYQKNKNEITISNLHSDSSVLNPNISESTIQPDSLLEKQVSSYLSSTSSFYYYFSANSGDSLFSHPEKTVWTRLKRDFVNHLVWKKISASIHKTSLLPLYGMLLLFLILFSVYLRHYCPEIYANNSNFLFIHLQVCIAMWATALFHKWALLLYAIPLMIFPVTVLMFFSPSLAAALWILICFMVLPYFPDKIEFLCVFLPSGLFPLFIHQVLSDRKKLIIIAITYVAALCSIYALYNIYIHKTYVIKHFTSYVPFLINSVGIFLTPGFVYTAEKTFGLISEFRLLELTDLRHPLLRQLSEQVPGTFHHTLQVSAMAEEGAYHLNGNVLLIRVGALYHDIGKIYHPEFFIENRNEKDFFQNDKSPEECAEIIIGHVRKGIELAYAYNLPEQIIDFIRTHHGNSRVEYFYRLELSKNAQADEKKFRYPGPLPFNKETAIVMLADSVEAASRTLKNPDEVSIQDMVEHVFQMKINDHQLIYSELTFKDIQTLKKLFTRRLIKIYHKRISFNEI